MRDLGAPSSGEPLDVDAALEALRACGGARVDPVRLRFIEALARRAGGHDGAARRVLDDKIARLLNAYRDDVERREPASADTGCRIDSGDAARATLADVVARAARRPAMPALGRATASKENTASTSAEASGDSKTLDYFRRTWARLSAEQRLAQSRSALPANAGPLNSHHLVHRSLTLMRELSPDYFDRFMTQVDALLWLEAANAAEANDAATAPRPARSKAAARTR